MEEVLWQMSPMIFKVYFTFKSKVNNTMNLTQKTLESLSEYDLLQVVLESDVPQDYKLEAFTVLSEKICDSLKSGL